VGRRRTDGAVIVDRRRLDRGPGLGALDVDRGDPWSTGDPDGRHDRTPVRRRDLRVLVSPIDGTADLPPAAEGLGAELTPPPTVPPSGVLLIASIRAAPIRPVHGRPQEDRQMQPRLMAPATVAWQNRSPIAS